MVTSTRLAAEWTTYVWSPACFWDLTGATLPVTRNCAPQPPVAPHLGTLWLTLEGMEFQLCLGDIKSKANQG